MNTGQDHFAKAACCQILDFLDNQLGFSAANTAACQRDRTVGAEMVAAVLDLDDAAALALDYLGAEFFEARRLVGVQAAGISPVIQAFPRLGIGILGQPGGDEGWQFGFADITDYDVSAQALCSEFDMTAHGDYDGLRILLPGSTNHLTGLTTGLTGNTAGIDDINIRFVLEAHDVITAGLEVCEYGIGFVAIRLTAQVQAGDAGVAFFERIDRCGYCYVVF